MNNIRYKKVADSRSYKILDRFRKEMLGHVVWGSYGLDWHFEPSGNITIHIGEMEDIAEFMRRKQIEIPEGSQE